MTQETISSIIAFHSKATANRAKHKVAIKLLQDNKLYSYIQYIAANSIRHSTEYKPLIKEVMTALKYEAPCVMLDANLIAIC
mgnify:CR=1 FL=1